MDVRSKLKLAMLKTQNAFSKNDQVSRFHMREFGYNFGKEICEYPFNSKSGLAYCEMW